MREVKLWFVDQLVVGNELNQQGAGRKHRCDHSYAYMQRLYLTVIFMCTWCLYVHVLAIILLLNGIELDFSHVTEVWTCKGYCVHDCNVTSYCTLFPNVSAF